MDSSDRKYDDLTVINYISQKTQTLLREHFNVRTYHDLATLSPAEIARLKTKLIAPMRGYVDGWCAEARELAGQSPTRAGESTNTAAGEETNPSAGKGEWEFVGAFLVEFRVLKVNGSEKEKKITVERREIDKRGSWLQDNGVKEPKEIKGEQLYEWMVEQLGEEVWQEPAEESPARVQSAEISSTAESSAAIKISQLHIFQPSLSKTPTHSIKASRPFEGSVEGNQPFTFKIDFELTGPAAIDIAKKQIECNARSYAYDRAKRKPTEPILLCETGPISLKEGKLAYTFTLSEATLQRGRYRLWVIVTCQDATLALPGYIEVPIFQVA